MEQSSTSSVTSSVGFESDKELDTLQEVRKAYERQYHHTKVGLTSDEDIKKWAIDLIDQAHKGAKSILAAAVEVLNNPTLAQQRLGDDYKNVQTIDKYVRGANQQVQSLSFKALDLKKLDNDQGTTALSTFQVNHIHLRAPFYTQNMVDRASTIIHEVFHIIGKSITHDKDVWFRNAYVWEQLVFRLAGIAWHKNEL